jgi:hypothetical protein
VTPCNLVAFMFSPPFAKLRDVTSQKFVDVSRVSASAGHEGLGFTCRMDPYFAFANCDASTVLNINETDEKCKL